MRRVAVVGAGHSKFGTRRMGLRSLFAEAAEECFASVDKGFEAARVQEAWIGSLAFGGGQLGNAAALFTEHAGLLHIPTRRVENACASSGFAFRDAYLAIRSGAVDIALAGGIEIMNDVPPLHQRFWLGVSGDTEWERLAGATFPGVYAMMASRHMHEYGTTREHLAAVAVKNHAFGARNPKAQFRRTCTVDDVLRGPMVADPLTLLNCCGTTDGATCVVLASAEAATGLTDAPVWVLGSGAASDRLALHDRESITRLDATVRAGREAFRRADVRPRDVDVAEVHDCFTIAEILALEDLGFCAKGDGGPYTESGATGLNGEVAVNPSGGLKAKGHPLGATGTGQVYEIFRQLRGQAEGGRQVDDAKIGLTHNVGGSGATCAVHLFGV
jgi:acetyl-CoA C-acetyltransferase/acetyl-CoA acyltransferase